MEISFRTLFHAGLIAAAIFVVGAYGMMAGLVIGYNYSLLVPSTTTSVSAEKVAYYYAASAATPTPNATVEANFQAETGKCAFGAKGPSPAIQEVVAILAGTCKDVISPAPTPTPEIVRETVKPETLIRTVAVQTSDSLLFIRAEKGSGVLEVYRSEPYEDALKAHAWYAFTIEAIESAWLDEDGKIFVSVVTVGADRTSLVYLEEPATGW